MPTFRRRNRDSTDLIKINVHFENAVWSKCVDQQTIKILSPVLTYTYYFYRKTFKGLDRQLRKKSVIDPSGYFNSGWIPRIKKHCRKNNMQMVLTGDWGAIAPNYEPKLPNKTLREDQLFLLKRVFVRNRGYVESPTGSGKTIILAGLISAYKDKKVILVVPSKTLLYQMESDLKAEGIKNIGLVGDGKNKPNKVTIGIINSLVKKITEPWVKNADLVLVDECHSVNKGNSYDTFLLACRASIRLGVTATPPDPDTTRCLYLEGLLGPFLGMIPIDSLIEEGVLARPIVILAEPRFPQDTDLIRDYKKSYDAGIVFNPHRNKLIAEISFDMFEKKKTVLVIIYRKEHGKEIMKALKLFPEMKSIYILGKTKGDEREDVRHKLENKEYDVVVASNIWKEGVNIKSLGAVINAAGWKSEKVVMQKLGRGMRTAEGKIDLYYFDFLDTGNKHLAYHALKRLAFYIRKGWEIIKY